MRLGCRAGACNAMMHWPGAAHRDPRQLFCNQGGKLTWSGHGQADVDDTEQVSPDFGPFNYPMVPFSVSVFAGEPNP
jgi:hypothetical protein